jgi:AcrR family transcriptional regulator
VIATVSRAERRRFQLRQEIIDAAFMKFSERGYHQTSISDIAKHLGIGHGTFYRYFDNKRDILEHVIDSVCEKIRLAMAKANAPTASKTLEDYEAQLARLGVSLSKILRETPGLFRILLLEATSIDPEMTRRITDFFDWCARQVDAYFENGMRQGFLRSDLDRQATAHVLVGMIFSTILMTINAGDPDLLKRMNSAVRRMLLDGIASRSDSPDRSELQ